MTTFKLNINIGLNQLPLLKQSSYNLCIAKQVNGVYTVVWSGTNDYLVHQTFEWTEEYQVFGEKTFQLGGLAKASTNNIDIKFGQTATLSGAGIMQPATGTPDRSGSFGVENEFGLISIGVNGRLGGGFAPIFVSPTVVSGHGRFEPVNSVKVWFSLAQKTKTMIFDWDTEGIEVTYVGDATEKTLAFEGPDGFGKWILG